ncbi:MAG: DUF58 domain-containing protein [Acidobacteria bacterium]|nr:DUF58 domain-containing protein [Acidobacteriota bacterium]MBI3424915.1 DUF58 domain-containing protein [Acidobacteriota bacterium]
MFNFLRRNNLSFAVVAGTLACLALGSLVIALTARQRGDLSWATGWMRAALGIFVLLVAYALPKLAQVVQPEALPFRAPFQLPGIGIAFGTFVIVVALTAFSTGNNLLYLIFSLLLATSVVSAVAARLNLTRLELDLKPPKHIFAGEPATLELTLTNRKRLLPSFSLLAVLQEPKADARELAFFAIVPPRARSQVRLTHTFARRGVYELQNLAVVTRFPFGFVERGYTLDSRGELVVYPALQPLREFEHSLPVALGQVESLRKGSGSDLYAIRQYRPADHRHTIDWKATAKTARLMVREFTREDDWRVTIHFDIRATVAESERFERAIALTASLLEYFIRAGAEVRLLIGAADFGYGSSRAHWYALLRELARLQVTEQAVAEPAATTAEWTGAELRNEFRIWLTSAAPAMLPSGLGASTQMIHFDEL